tara:strand:- start:2093 stop:2302 length:210 start_codon:yes stop_codon:yes gene_type:complete
MKISIWIDERQLENLKKLLNKNYTIDEADAVMFERSEGYYPCDTNVIIDSDDFIFLRDKELLVLEQEQY